MLHCHQISHQATNAHCSALPSPDLCQIYTSASLCARRAPSCTWPHLILHKMCGHRSRHSQHHTPAINTSHSTVNPRVHALPTDMVQTRQWHIPTCELPLLNDLEVCWDRDLQLVCKLALREVLQLWRLDVADVGQATAHCRWLDQAWHPRALARVLDGERWPLDVAQVEWCRIPC